MQHPKENVSGRKYSTSVDTRPAATQPDTSIIVRLNDIKHLAQLAEIPLLESWTQLRGKWEHIENVTRSISTLRSIAALADPAQFHHLNDE